MPKGGKPKQQKKRAEKAAQQKNKKAEREERKRRRKDRDRYTDDEDKRFAAQLAAAGLRVNEVDADGNCLFRALADQVEGSAKHHGKYRDEIVAFMRRDEERFKWFVEDDEDWDDYLARLGRDGECASASRTCGSRRWREGGRVVPATLLFAQVGRQPRARGGGEPAVRECGGPSTRGAEVRDLRRRQ